MNATRMHWKTHPGSRAVGACFNTRGMIACLQRLKHYEIAVYGTLATLARHLELVNDERLLRENLAEEKQADASLTELAQGEVNPDALAA